MKKLPILISFLFSTLFLWSANPVPYSGKVAIRGVNYFGDAQFTFSLQDKDGKTHWQNGKSKDDSIKVNIRNGRYTVLLGGQGMSVLPPQLFLDNDELYLKVRFDDGDGKGLRHLAPDQRITATPRALVAEVAKIAKNADSAKVADSVQAGAITKSMLGQDVLSDLNRTVTSSEIAANTITTAQLNEQILKYLKPEITLAPQAPGLIFNGQTITLHSRAEGKYLNYQWYKNGQAIAGADKKRFVIEDVNGTQHDGNYTLVVSNDFGSITTQPTSLVVDGTPTSHTVASISMDMIFCPPGTFTMGSPSSETGRGGDETEHSVTLSHGFYLGKHEVTQAQYETIMTGNPEGLNVKPSNWPNNNDRPVEKVSWNDVQIFLTRLNTMEQTAGRLPTGWKYVLPTEAQWEYACRAGTTTAYSWGNDINSSRANYNWDGAHNTGNDFKQTRDVGLYAANPWGFFDMQGNVWEWVSDWKANYLTGAQTDPEGPASGSFGSYGVVPGTTTGRTCVRLSALTHPRSPPHNLGFRVGFQPVQPDTVNPELELFGGASVTREAGQAWAEPGAAGHDARDGNLTASVTVTGTVDMNTTGTYVLTYSVADAAGNTATANRTVTVVGNRSVDLNATVAMDMLWVPAGTFTMGSPTTEAGRQSDREDEHNVSLTQGFYLGKYEVTQAQYEAVMTGNTDSLSATPSQWPNNPNRPVEKVSWADAQIFLTRLNAQQSANIPAGWAYVLPTESQWEYACRAGTTTAYSWGATIASSNANWNHGADPNQTVDVGQFSANPWGFFDMHGNVWEWTADWYQAAYPTGNPVVDPPDRPRARSGPTGWFLDNVGTTCVRLSASNTPRATATTFGFRVGFQKQ